MWLILVATALIIVNLMVLSWVFESLQFKPGHNKFARICRQCGAHQNKYRSNVIGENREWWEEVYPIGNDPDCSCHTYARRE
jgi:hypothetical protein